jgi:two-component system phosphate regulon sensor histidine kinase PhoR
MEMEAPRAKLGHIVLRVAVTLGVFAALYLVSRTNFLLFHVTLESFAIFVGLLIYLLASTTYEHSRDSFLLFLGIGYLFVSVVDFAHLITYRGMNVVPELLLPDTPVKLWIAQRALLAGSFLAATFFIDRKFAHHAVTAVYLVVTAVLLYLIVGLDAFPACVIEGQGQTTFKIAAEYTIMATVLLAMARLSARKTLLYPPVFTGLMAAMATAVAAEAAFTLQREAFGLAGFAGHVLNFISFYYVFRMIIWRGIKVPYDRVNTAVRNQRTLLGDLIEHSPVCIAVVAGQEHRYELANPCYRKLIGRPGTGGRIIGHPFAEVYPGIEGDAVAALREACRTQLPVWIRESPSRDARHWNLHFVPLRDAEGASQRTLIFAWDVTEMVAARRKAEELAAHLAETSSQWEAIFSSISDGVLVIDESGRLVAANRAAAALCGLESPEDLSAEIATVRDRFAVQHPDGRPIALRERPANRWLEGPAFTNFPCRLLSLDGTRAIDLLVSGGPVSSPAGVPRRALFVVKEVTELRRLERAKDDFLQVLAHELRNPLTAAHGLIQLVSRRLCGPGIDRVGSYLRLAEAELSRLDGLITDIISGYRVSSGRLQLDLGLLGLQDVLRDATAPYAPVHLERELIMSELPERPIPVIGDAKRLVEVIANLLSNATKYSPPGTRIWVSVVMRDGRALVKVEDEGLGIPPDQLERVFDGFYRATNLTSRQPGGIGLGLYISRDIIRRHGGELWAENREGGGTAMCILLPLAPGTPPAGRGQSAV